MDQLALLAQLESLVDKVRLAQLALELQEQLEFKARLVLLGLLELLEFLVRQAQLVLQVQLAQAASLEALELLEFKDKLARQGQLVLKARLG